MKEIMQVILLCGRGEAWPSSADCTAPTLCGLSLGMGTAAWAWTLGPSPTWDPAALLLLPAPSVTWLREEQADGVMGQSCLGSRNLSADGVVAPGQEPRLWISAMGLLAALAG